MSVQRVFQISELLGQILSYLDPLCLIRLRSVSKSFNYAIFTSPPLSFYTGNGLIYGKHYASEETPQLSENSIFTPMGLHILSGFWKQLTPHIIRIPSLGPSIPKSKQKGRRGAKVNPIKNVNRSGLLAHINSIYATFMPAFTKFQMLNPRIRVKTWKFEKSEHWRQLDIPSTGEFDRVFFPMSRHPVYKEYLPFRILVDMLTFVYEFALEEGEGGSGVGLWDIFAKFEVEAIVCEEEEEEEEDKEGSDGEKDDGEDEEEDGSDKTESLYEEDSGEESGDETESEIEEDIEFSFNEGDPHISFDDPGPSNYINEADLYLYNNSTVDWWYEDEEEEWRSSRAREKKRLERNRARYKRARLSKKYSKILKLTKKETSTDWKACSGCEKVMDTIMFGGCRPWGLDVANSPVTGDFPSSIRRYVIRPERHI
ncbi:hypothetical protein TWF730_004543 [Orbilia blumenaviensis]|uniref:F-box domain-containing protein n=1 Tax=Orbilia blumenaviensis TaxID=1796055 RepID=A0AAV9TYR9_9PEZI